MTAHRQDRSAAPPHAPGGARRGRRSVLAALLAGCVTAGCGSGELAATPEPVAATRDVYPCDPPGHRLAADLLGVERAELRPGERYPSTGSCVFWTRSDPGDFGVVQLVGLDSDPPAWPCGPHQVTRQERADLNGSPAWVRACTTP